MKIRQLSLFLENNPAHLKVPCQILADAGSDTVTLSLADTQQFGILRLIVHEWEKGRDALQNAGYTVKVTEVVAVEVPDRPGGLAELLDLVDKCKLSIEYMYAFTYRHGDKAIMLFGFANPDAAIDALHTRDINVVGNVEFFAHSDHQPA